MRRLVPKASAPTCLSALEATGWDADEAYKHLRAFLEVEEKAQKDAAADAKREEKKRKREALKKSRRETSASESGSSDLIFRIRQSSSSSSSRRRAKRKKHKKHKRKDKRKAKHKRGKDKNASSDDEDDRGRPSRAEKRRKRAKREKKKLPAAFGARGVIRETDKNEKEPEFRAWLEEVKRVNLESVTKHEEREYFKEYAEDYNTNTLPGEKFYNLDRWAVAETAPRPPPTPPARRARRRGSRSTTRPSARLSSRGARRAHRGVQEVGVRAHEGHRRPAEPARAGATEGAAEAGVQRRGRRDG